MPAFTIQPTPPVPAATVPMPSCATVTPCAPTQNFVASGANAVQGPTFPVAVAGTSSTTAVACGSASTDVRSTVDGTSLPTSTAGVAGQSSTTPTSSGSGAGSPSGTSPPPPPPPVGNGSSTSPPPSFTAVGHRRAATTVDYIYVVYQSTCRRRASVADSASVVVQDKLEALP